LLAQFLFNVKGVES